MTRAAPALGLLLVLLPPAAAQAPTRPLSAPARCGAQEHWELAIRFLRFTGARVRVDLQGGCQPGTPTVVTGDAETTFMVRPFWRIRDRIQTELEPVGPRTLVTRIWQDENGTRTSREERYLGTQVCTRTQLPGRPPADSTVDVPPETVDPFTALLGLRAEPLRDGEVYAMPLFSDGKVYQGTVRVLGRQACDTPDGPARCAWLRATFTRDGVPSSVAAEIWLTDDARRLPAAVDAVTSYGRLTSVLTAARGVP